MFLILYFIISLLQLTRTPFPIVAIEVLYYHVVNYSQIANTEVSLQDFFE